MENKQYQPKDIKPAGRPPDNSAFTTSSKLQLYFPFVFTN